MNNNASLKSNVIFQGMYQVVMLVIPLILSPYLTRTLGEDALGVYSFTYTVAYYFVIFAMLGIVRYGQSAIASVRDNTNVMRKVFWSLYATHLFVSIISLVSYLLFCMFFTSPQDRTIYIVQGIYVLSAAFDITWLFYGLEKFKSVVYKNFFVKVIELIAVFTLVKEQNDLWIYTLIMATSVLLGQIIMIPQAVKLVKPIRFNKNDMLPHIRPLLTLWISVLATALYTIFDKTLLGLLTEKKNVAFYEYADKLVRVPVSLLTAISTVTYPRMCNLIAKEGSEKTRDTIFSTSILLTSFLAFGAMSIIISIANDFISLYYGAHFSVSGPVMASLSPVIVLISLGDIIRTQIMIPRKMDHEFIYIICINAIVNLILSFLLIPELGIYGAVIGTCAAEVCGLVLNTIVSRKYFSIKSLCLDTVPFLLFFVAAVALTYIVNNCVHVDNLFKSVLIQLLCSGGVYCTCSLIYFIFTKKRLLRFK